MGTDGNCRLQQPSALPALPHVNCTPRLWLLQNATTHCRLHPCRRDAAAFRRNLQTAHALWARLAEEVRSTDLAAAEAAGDTTSLRVCLAKLQARLGLKEVDWPKAAGCRRAGGLVGFTPATLESIRCTARVALPLGVLLSPEPSCGASLPCRTRRPASC